MDKVTLIVPVYNVEKYLKRCIDSILNQSYKNIEIICVNDCSPDNSQEILNDYEKKQQIRVIINEKNMGLGKSRERALKESTGKYIMFIDSDDYIDTYYFTKCAFLFPSRAEGFGMPVVEVMNYDKPVIASNLSIFQELIGDEINYFTISDDNKESAKRLAKRMSDYEQPTEGSYEKIIERYVPQNLAKNLSAYFRQQVTE